MTSLGQLLVCGFAAEGPSAALREALRAGERAGVILFKRNIGELGELCRTLAELGDALVGIDQEGGRVARLGAPVLELPPAARLARLGPDGIERVATLHSAELRALGVSWNFAPVLDVSDAAHGVPDVAHGARSVIGDRSFGTNAEDAARGAVAFARGMRRAGLLACGKHFPGHGGTRTDSHLELPIIEGERARLELGPFRAAIADQIPSLMTAHVLYPALAPEPATLARAIATDLLRGELGFEGVLVSDDLEMRAISARWGYGDAAVAAIEAGCDLLLVCSSEEAQEEAIAALTRRHEASSAFRARASEALARVAAMKSKISKETPSFARFLEIARSEEARACESLLKGL